MATGEPETFKKPDVPGEKPPSSETSSTPAAKSKASAKPKAKKRKGWLDKQLDEIGALFDGDDEDEDERDEEEPDKEEGDEEE